MSSVPEHLARELRGRLGAFVALLESAALHILADLQGPDYVPPSKPSGDSFALEVAEHARALTGEILAAPAEARAELARGGLLLSLARTLKRLREAMAAMEMPGGPVGELANALESLQQAILGPHAGRLSDAG